MSKEVKKSKKKNNRKLTVLLGLALLLVGLSVLILTYWPVIKAYYNQKTFPTPSTTNVSLADNDEDITKEVKKDTKEVFVDSNFGVYIPKIKSNSKVVKDVDPFNEKEYINALQTGVAHSKTTTTPNKPGNVFLFAHSAVNFYERNMYSVYFYLLGELEKEDEIFLSYEGVIYKYRVQEVKIVNREDVQYLKRSADPDTLVLMTCYPAGTDWKRTIVIAHRDSQEPVNR